MVDISGWEDYSRQGGTSTPPPSPDMFGKFMSGAKDFINNDAFPVVMGQAAKAFTAEEPLSWQHQLGNVGDTLGKSNIAAKAANRQATKQEQLSKMLSDILGGNVPYTDATKDGLTTANIKVNSD